MNDPKDLIPFLRENGVEHFECPQWKVTLRPPESAKAKQASPVAPLLDDEEVCKCGHPMYNHGDAGCKLGCYIGTCVPVADRNHETFPSFSGEDEG